MGGSKTLEEKSGKKSQAAHGVPPAKAKAREEKEG
jgi:hypothetical protein